MSALDEYIDDPVNDREPEDGFPKNESSREELFAFGKRLIGRIVESKKVAAALRAENAELREALEPFAMCAEAWQDVDPNVTVHTSRFGFEDKPDLTIIVSDLLAAAAVLAKYEEK